MRYAARPPAENPAGSSQSCTPLLLLHPMPDYGRTQIIFYIVSCGIVSILAGSPAATAGLAPRPCLPACLPAAADIGSLLLAQRL